jgi:hypothetical protein
MIDLAMVMRESSKLSRRIVSMNALNVSSAIGLGTALSFLGKVVRGSRMRHHRYAVVPVIAVISAIIIIPAIGYQLFIDQCAAKPVNDNINIILRLYIHSLAVERYPV